MLRRPAFDGVDIHEGGDGLGAPSVAAVPTVQSPLKSGWSSNRPIREFKRPSQPSHVFSSAGDRLGLDSMDAVQRQHTLQPHVSLSSCSNMDAQRSPARLAVDRLDPVGLALSQADDAAREDRHQPQITSKPAARSHTLGWRACACGSFASASCTAS